MTETAPPPAAPPDSEVPPKRRRWWKRILVSLLLVILGAAVAAVVIVPRQNMFQVNGEITINGLRKPITIVRDEKGMPYIHADNRRDLFFGQGFATAQDRFFQMHLMKLRACGRLTELAGEVARDLDIRSRTIGLRRAAEAHSQILDDENRDIFQAFADGVNAFLDTCPQDIPLEFQLAGLEPEQWQTVDSLSLLYLMGWDTSANLRHEVIGQALIDVIGPEKARELFPLNINPDVEADTQSDAEEEAAQIVPEQLNVLGQPLLTSLMDSGPLHVGSNNWVTGKEKSAGGQVILSGDPHLDPRMLPGIMYAAGYIGPEMRAVGAGVPGIPGFIIGRNERVACSVTNNYGDVQDLYVETVDSNNAENYLDGGESIPFQTITETLTIKDSAAPNGLRTEDITIRLTSRGPVVTEVLSGVSADRVLTLRWAAVESMLPDTGLAAVLTARSVDDLEDSMRSVTAVILNLVFADIDGNIAWRAIGRVPLRTPATGTLPFVVDPENPAEDNWQGWIPFEEMPHTSNPERNWLGTANHWLIEPDYVHYYSNYASASFRYRQLKNRMAEDKDGLSVDDHWSIQRDTKNLLAEAVTPLLIDALAEDETTQPLADVLRGWDCHDTVDQSAPTVFQTVFTEFARETFEDELGTETADLMLGTWYFWQERLLHMIRAGQSSWFDDQSTSDVTETMEDLIRRAGRSTVEKLSPKLGRNPIDWMWGRTHTMQFDNPIRRSGVGREWLGTSPRAVDGSGETLYRGWYSLKDPHKVAFAAALRMVVDFGDSEKVRAVLAGGSAGRTFHPHQKDQLDAYFTGEPLHWWFSDKAIAEHEQSRLVLNP